MYLGRAWMAQSVNHPISGSGHDLAVHGFKPCVRLCAGSSEPGACFRFCVSFSLWPSPAHTLSLKRKRKKKGEKERRKGEERKERKGRKERRNVSDLCSRFLAQSSKYSGISREIGASFVIHNKPLSSNVSFY